MGDIQRSKYINFINFIFINNYGVSENHLQSSCINLDNQSISKWTLLCIQQKVLIMPHNRCMLIMTAFVLDWWKPHFIRSQKGQLFSISENHSLSFLHIFLKVKNKTKRNYRKWYVYVFLYTTFHLFSYK